MSKTRRIGVAVNAQHLHAEDQQLYGGIREYSRTHEGFDCVLAPFAAEDMKAASRCHPPYDGVLAQATPELVAEAKRSRVPVVDVWRDSRVRVSISCVFPDFAKAGRMAGQHLVSRGFEYFGYVVNRSVASQATMCDATAINEDALGYAAYVAARGFTCSRFIAPRVVDANAKVWQKWCREIHVWIEAQPKPLALFVYPAIDMMSMYGANVLMIIVGFPLSLPGMIVFPLLNIIDVNALLGTHLALPALLWLTLFAAGYFQWFVLGPRIADLLIEIRRGKPKQKD